MTRVPRPPRSIDRLISIGLRSGKASRDASVVRPESAVLPEPQAMGVRSSLPGCFTGPGRPREGMPAKRKSDGICTRIPLSASPCEQVGCAIQIRPLQHISSAIAAPNKSPRRTSMITAFGTARTDGLRLELCGTASRPLFSCARRSDTQRPMLPTRATRPRCPASQSFGPNRRPRTWRTPSGVRRSRPASRPSTASVPRGSKSCVGRGMSGP